VGGGGGRVYVLLKGGSFKKKKKTGLRVHWQNVSSKKKFSAGKGLLYSLPQRMKVDCALGKPSKLWVPPGIENKSSGTGGSLRRGETIPANQWRAPLLSLENHEHEKNLLHGPARVRDK